MCAIRYKGDESMDSLYCLIREFRDAIIVACSNREFDPKDRMSRFPNGCCDDACDLLAFYLYHAHSIQVVQFNGAYYDDIEPENNTNHNWLKFGDCIIDITYSQFYFKTNSQDEIYYGKENKFYKSLDRIHSVTNYDIRSDSRLWKDYQIIVSHL